MQIVSDTAIRENSYFVLANGPVLGHPRKDY